MADFSQQQDGSPSQNEGARQVHFHGVPEGSWATDKMSLAMLDPKLYERVKNYQEKLVTNDKFKFLQKKTTLV